MASELNMYQAQVNEHKYEEEKLSRELAEMKKKYYQQKRKEKLMEELELDGSGGGGGGGGGRGNYFASSSSSAPQNPVLHSRTTPASLQNQQVVAAKSARTRYTGGGYAIK
eukprot:scaffold369_cov177-Ochromonas_danica.AAC.44